MTKYIIQKKQKNNTNFKINNFFFDSARSGLKEILNSECCKNKTILLPAYIGYSTKEGSGIFDPIKETETPYIFYNLTSKMEIDSENFKKQIDRNKNGILLFVHYFGFKDNNLEVLKKYAVEKGFIIIEDCAHALYSFYKCPDYSSDFILFSLHKMLPFKNGGLVLSQKYTLATLKRGKKELLNYDFEGISNRRRENYLYLENKIKKVNNNDIQLLYASLGNNIPQTLPVIISSLSLRDHLYFELNKRNIGVVSLYHQLIEPLSLFSNEIEISNHILNLPIHQDIGENEIDYYFNVMINLLK